MKYRTIDTRLGLLLAAGLLAACATPTPPAPVVNRTSSNAPAPAVTPAPAPAPVATKPKDDGVQVAPARPGGVEVRPLGGAPAPAPAPAAVAPPPVPSPSLLRVGPKALKRPYSEATLAEMQAADANAGAATGGVTATVAKPPEPAPVPKVEEPKAAAAPDAKGGLSFDWPAKGKVLQGFSEPSNLGLAIDGKPGDPVAAAADGKVIFSGPGPRGYGNLLIVKHDADTVSVYAHNKSLLVKEGQTVKRGQKIAEIGDTGTDKPNLHFEIRRQGRPIDPAKLLPKR